MSLLTVEKLSHGFGDRAIFENASFQLNKGDKIGLIGVNGEGKSTFMQIITGTFVFFLTSAEQRSCLQYICTYKNSDRKREYAP